jgi:hypothetical protein
MRPTYGWISDLEGYRLLNDIEHQFLLRLYEETNGDPAVKVSMYDIGSALGLDRDAASRVAQDLIGSELIEIRTLGGGISISAEGLAQIQSLIAGKEAADSLPATLPDDAVMNSAAAQSIEQVSNLLKAQVGQLGLDYDGLTELTADLKSMDAQLASSRPKTAVVRECLRSIRDNLQRVGENQHLSTIRRLLGE